MGIGVTMKCSICGNDYEFAYKKDEPLPPHCPFCSKRCKAIDLGKWLNNEYRISTLVRESEDLAKLESGFSGENEEDLLTTLLDKDMNEV